jgi:hypothetical protein
MAANFFLYSKSKGEKGVDIYNEKKAPSSETMYIRVGRCWNYGTRVWRRFVGFHEKKTQKTALKKRFSSTYLLRKGHGVQ